MPDANVSRHLRTAARETPGKRAVVLASGASITFAQLDAECDRFAQHFAARGIGPGMRVIVFVKPGLAFVPTIFGCFRLGAVPVCIDPGMKLRHLLACVREAKPEAVIGIRRALAVARLFPKAFASARLRVTVPRVRPGHVPDVRFCPPPVSGEAPAAVLFTSGSTGIPKGVIYTHSIFDAQQRLLRETYGIGREETDLVVFPLFALFAAAWGITAVIPRMNPARPARANGRHLAKVIRRFGVTHSAGSPAIWKRLVEHCRVSEVRLPSLRRILMAGAQVPEKLVRAMAEIAVEVHTPYGATEALPLTTISHLQLFERYARTREGAGTCVGKPLPGVEVAIIPFIENPIPEWDEALRLPAGVKGEVTVRAPWVTREYFGKAEATRKAKIASAHGPWHRMGDVGYLDDQGNLWFCGRKDHRIFSSSGLLFPDPMEAIFDNHPAVRRSAVVGVGPRGAQRPVLVVEGVSRSGRLVEELRAHALRFPSTRGISAIAFRKRFPVDVRHNIKIDRPGLARLVERELG